MTALSAGEFLGALSAGFLIKTLSYSYSILLSIMLHIAGYLVYALTVNGWMMMLSRVLAGMFIGLEDTLAFAYFGESYEEWKNLMAETGKEKKQRVRVKDTLFALFTITTNVAYLFGPG